MKHTNIEAITVCVGYGDFLLETVKHNAPHFRKWVIVTSPDDKLTQDVCRNNWLTCLVTDDHKRDGIFSKGRCVERGLQHLSADAWVLHIDADIVLPNRFHHILDKAHLDGDHIYGCDRIMIRSYQEWLKLKQTGWLHGGFDEHCHSIQFPGGYQIGARWAGLDGFVPIGFFQLWNRLDGGEEVYGTRVKSYPVGHGNACREDVQHGLRWDRRKRELIPELLVVHLESEKCKTGANWNGRTTARFGNPPNPVGNSCS